MWNIDFPIFSDPSRSIEILGPMNHIRLGTLMRRIQELKSASSNPITVYIKSRGGSIRTLDAIENTIRSAAQNGNRCKLIAVGRAKVQSAAAYLLAASDYSYVEAGTELIFHGARRVIYRRPKSLTREEAIHTAMRLGNQNRTTATKMARAIIARMLRRHATPPILSKLINEPMDHMPMRIFVSIIDSIKAALISEQSIRIIDESMNHTVALNALTRQFCESLSQKGFEKSTLKDHDIMKHCFASSVTDERASNEVNLINVILEFLFVSEIFSQKSHVIVDDLVLNLSLYSSIHNDATLRGASTSKRNAERENFTRNTALLLWQFALSFSHRLLIGDNGFGANDACGLGLVDKVIDVPCEPAIRNSCS